MKRSRFNEEQIIATLKEQESGLLTADYYPRRRCNTLFVGASNTWKLKRLLAITIAVDFGFQRPLLGTASASIYDRHGVD